MADGPDATHPDELEVTIELGRAQMDAEGVGTLQAGIVVPLDRCADDPVDVVAGGRLVARGAVVVIDDRFCVRVVEIIAPDAG